MLLIKNMLYLKALWQKLNRTQQKIFKIIGLFSLILFTFYWVKFLIIQHFIQQFLKKPPIIAISKAQIHSKQSYYHTIGQLKAKRSTTLSVQSPGIVEHILVKPGQFVKKHQPILQLNAQVESANLSIQEAEYKLAKHLFSQQSLLYQKNNISKSQFLEAKTRLKKAQAQFHEAQARLQQKTLYAPFSGIVGIPEVERGDYVNPGQQTLISLQQSQTLYLDFYLPEQYYSAVHINDSVYFRHNQQDTKLFEAKIIAIQPASQRMAHTIWIRARIDNRHDYWIPGLAVHVNIRTHFQPKAVFIPNQCLLGSPEGPIVFVVKQKINPTTHHQGWWVEQRQVKIGLSSKNQTQIISGLTGKEYLVSSGTQKVRDQSFVHVKTTGHA